MLSDNERVSSSQMGKLVFLGGFGMGVFVLPRRAAAIAGQGGWLVTAGLTLAALAGAWL